MSSISSTPSPALQQGFQQLKLQQARRNAEQAEMAAQALGAQAANAKLEASQAQEVARDLGVRAEQAAAGAGQARQGLAAIRSLSETSSSLQVTYERIATAMQAQTGTADSADVEPTLAVTEAATLQPTTATTLTSSSTSINAQGQTTGTVINTTA